MYGNPVRFLYCGHFRTFNLLLYSMNHQCRVGTESVTTSLDLHDPKPGNYLECHFFFLRVLLVMRIFAKHAF